MTRQDQQNLVAAFRQRFSECPTKAELREWMRDVRWILNLTPGGMNKAYRILDAEMRRKFGAGPACTGSKTTSEFPGVVAD